jgi:uncharacterized protein
MPLNATATARAAVFGAAGLLLANAFAPAQAQSYRGGGFPFMFSPSPYFESPRRTPRHNGYRRIPHHHAYTHRERERSTVQAPPPLKMESKAEHSGIVIGDSLADWLAFGLEQAYADSSDVAVVRKTRSSAGLADPCKGEFRKWLEQVLATEKPSFIAVMLGTNDRRPMRPCEPGKAEGAPTVAQAFRSKEWGEAYGKEVDEAISQLKGRAVPIFWVGLPPARNIRAADLSLLNAIYREHAQRAGIGFIDIWDAFLDEDGDFAMRGPDVNGQERRLRAADGLHFTEAGARKLALFVEREVNRVVLHAPSPAAAAPAPASKPAAEKPQERPIAGPVMPLTRAQETVQELLGASKDGRNAPGYASSRNGIGPGTPRAARGRADDFSWPGPASAPEMQGSPAGIPASESGPRVGR